MSKVHRKTSELTEYGQERNCKQFTNLLLDDDLSLSFVWALQ